MASPARVLWLIKGLGPGGAERLLVESAGFVDRDDFEVTVCYLLPWKDQLAGELTAAGIAVSCLSVRHHWGLGWILRLRRLIAEQGIDLVHAHLPYAGIGARIAARTMGARRPAVVYTEHNSWTRYVPVTRRLNAWTFGLNDASIAVSRSVADSIGRRPGLTVIPNGIDFEAVRTQALSREDARAELGIPQDRQVVGTIGGLTPKKAHADLVRAARTVADRIPDSMFVFIGLPVDRAPVEAEISALGLRNHVMLAGYRPSAARLLRAFDVYCLPSRFEGMPLSLLEAMSLGLPVVATRAGGVPEAVTDGENGVLVPVGDSRRLAGALADLLAAPGRGRELGEKAHAEAERFGIREMVRRTEAVYRGALELRR